ncbi:hypothetical protein PoB_002400900 [Plakobranchus ocellatus]|uniref:Uncharacterized protein n=1 Tax=Plakobranchus ocellatus TaxID=259542 RepID=A0AAV3ZSW0_9GAST|nr:hypothetical protein PoB_002400900 [Plakobranchus ocellatus]
MLTEFGKALKTQASKKVRCKTVSRSKLSQENLKAELLPLPGNMKANLFIFFILLAISKDPVVAERASSKDCPPEMRKGTPLFTYCFEKLKELPALIRPAVHKFMSDCAKNVIEPCHVSLQLQKNFEKTLDQILPAYPLNIDHNEF